MIVAWVRYPAVSFKKIAVVWDFDPVIACLLHG